MRAMLILLIAGSLLAGCGTKLIRPEFTADTLDSTQIGRDYLKNPSIRKLEEKVFRLSVGNDAKREHLIFAELEGKLDRDQVMAAYGQLDKPVPLLIEEYLGTIPDAAKNCTLALSENYDWIGEWKFMKGECSNGKVHGIAHVQSIEKKNTSSFRDYYGRFINGDLVWAIMSKGDGYLYIGDFKGAKAHGQGAWRSGSVRYISGMNHGYAHGWAVKFKRDERTQKYFLSYVGQLKNGNFDGLVIKNLQHSFFVVQAYDRHTPQEIMVGYYKNNKRHGPVSYSHWDGYGDLDIWSGTYLDGLKNGIGKYENYAKKKYDNKYFYSLQSRYGGYKDGKREGRHNVVNNPDSFGEEHWAFQYANDKKLREWQTQASTVDNIFGKIATVGIGAVAFNNIGLPQEKAFELQAAFAVDVFNDTGGTNIEATIGGIQAEADAMKFASINTGNIAQGASTNRGSTVSNTSTTTNNTAGRSNAATGPLITNCQPFNGGLVGPLENGKYCFTVGNKNQRQCDSLNQSDIDRTADFHCLKLNNQMKKSGSSQDGLIPGASNRLSCDCGVSKYGKPLCKSYYSFSCKVSNSKGGSDSVSK